MTKLMKILTTLAFSTMLLTASEFVVDKTHSQVAFKVKHMMISNVQGNFNEYDADIEFDTKTMQFTALSAEMETKSVDTGIEKRDNHLRSADFFDAKKNPTITFEMKSYKGDKEEGKMEGNLTIRGISKPVTLDVEIGGIIKDPAGITRLGFVLEGKIKRKDFGLKWNKLLEAGGLAVSETVKLIIEIEALEEEE
ncbi:MAG: polyisoprenoid-binding protein [Sulfurovaceae bacterium]|nr:polyisoprenoid-binding protein [Sulfurovaceae bacterium]